ncbi:MAG: GNAT family N-acetyltransferase [Bacilli bacterium]|nr:GNAT family N-acetyltransferase [Bacilli bacterium]MBN2876329.1 GNAT family N-acetyltransferase [Bacilli bacterium]
MIKVYKTGEEFLLEYGAFLTSDEIKHNLMIGISSRADITNMVFVASVIEDRILLGLLAGKKLIIAANTLEQDVYYDLVNHMKKISYPGIIGEKEVCLVYQSVFTEWIHKEMEVEMNQRIYSCDEVISQYQTDGICRLATEDDFEVLRFWYNDFNRLVEAPMPLEITDPSLHESIANQRVYVLEEQGVLVSMAGRARPLSNSETVGLVYTPDHLRNHGYASILVEYVTKEILKEKSMATLYTDLSNPTSNSVYMKIGYKPYCDSLVLRIEEEMEN